LTKKAKSSARGVTMCLNGQVAIITGAASGIGRSIAEVFAEAGIAGLTVADIDAKAADQTVAFLSKNWDCKAIATQTDVANAACVEEMVEATIRTFGRIDILVNNAGICPMTAWDDTTLDTWNRILAINLTGAYLCTKAALPHMRRNKYGRIVYISSVGAFLGSLVGHVAYGASKAGMIALMKSVAKGFCREGINANAIAPWTISTKIPESFGEPIVAQWVENTPLKRQGQPREVADAALYLVSDRSTYITGATLHVNGGYLLV